MLTMPLRPALAAFRLPSRTVAAQPTCAAQVAAVMDDFRGLIPHSSERT
jgi:hypothetical protein